jgi:hypothetical protein
MTETQQRFLKEIAGRVNGGRVAELRLYPTLRVGQVESGVAIVATAGDVRPAVEPSGAEIVESLEAPVTETPVDAATATGPERLSILTAHFRHTVKGPDRGKWEFSLVHDADAPIEIVENVVRGVARRAGEDGEPELLSGDDFQRALTEPWFHSAT